MIQGATFLHLNHWDKQCGGWGKFTKFLRSCGYERRCVLQVPAKFSFHLHSAEPSGLPWMTFGHSDASGCYLQLFVQVWELFSMAGVHKSICCCQWAKFHNSGALSTSSSSGMNRMVWAKKDLQDHPIPAPITQRMDVSPGLSRRKLVPTLGLLLCGGMDCWELSDMCCYGVSWQALSTREHNKVL